MLIALTVDAIGSIIAFLAALTADLTLLIVVLAVLIAFLKLEVTLLTAPVTVEIVLPMPFLRLLSAEVSLPVLGSESSLVWVSADLVGLVTTLVSADVNATGLLTASLLLASSVFTLVSVSAGPLSVVLEVSAFFSELSSEENNFDIPFLIPVTALDSPAVALLIACSAVLAKLLTKLVALLTTPLTVLAALPVIPLTVFVALSTAPVTVPTIELEIESDDLLDAVLPEELDVPVVLDASEESEVLV